MRHITPSLYTKKVTLCLLFFLFFGWSNHVLADNHTEITPKPLSVMDRIKQKNQQRIQDLPTAQKAPITQTKPSKPEGPKMIYSRKYLQGDQAGRIYLPSITSISVRGTNIMYCSRIARENLHRLSGLPYYIGLDIDGTQVSQQDAVQLAQQGIKEGIFVEVASGVDLIDTMDEIAPLYNGTIYDVFLYMPYKDGEVMFEDIAGYDLSSRYARRYFRQTHRITVFLATDGKWYALDPLRGERSRTPQLLEEYALLDEFNGRTRHIKTPPYALEVTYRNIVSSQDLQPENREIEISSGKLTTTVFFAEAPKYGSSVKIRQEAKRNSEQLGTIPAGTSVRIEAVEDGWYTVSYEGISGRISLHDVVLTTQEEELPEIFNDLYQQLIQDTSSIAEERTYENPEKQLPTDEEIRIKLLQKITHINQGEDGDILALEDAHDALLYTVITKKDIAFDVVHYLYKQYDGDTSAISEQDINKAIRVIATTFVASAPQGVETRVLTNTMTIPLTHGEDYHFEVGSVVFVLGSDIVTKKDAYDLEFVVTHPVSGEEILLHKQGSEGSTSIFVFSPEIRKRMTGTLHTIMKFSKQMLYYIFLS